MYKGLKARVLLANLFLKEEELVKLTWGNVSEIDRKAGVIAIKPSGVSYNQMKAEDIVIVDLDGNVVDGKLKPSSDLATHVEIYKRFPTIGGITHTHSTYATAWSQAKKGIKFYGTTHGDHFNGSVIVTRDLTDEEINGEYEKNTGLVICEELEKSGEDPIHNPAVLVANHAPFTFGKDAYESAKNSLVLEEVAKMAYLTIGINDEVEPGKETLLAKHFNRKHGANSYYGQNK